ncbi:MAG: hypothetical protein R3Y28_05505 [Candidatus Gastranaerophilales bacterium]
MLKVSPNQTIKDFSGSRRFVRGMASKSLAPLMLLECFVSGGRSIQAFDRGGFDEGRERLTEEAIGAGFWFGGVKFFNNINDKIGKKLLNLHDTNFDVGEDALRKPIKNFMKDDKLGTSAKKIATFKIAKVSASILLANTLVGFVVPKINQSITKYYHRNDKDLPENSSTQSSSTQNSGEQNPIKQQIHSGDNFVYTKSIDKFGDTGKNDDVSFNGLGNTQALLNLANTFENNSKVQLLSTDVGIAGGRGVSARNNYERTEVLFRDLSSIYFYMFCMPHMNSLLNQIESGKSTRIDPVAEKQVSDHMIAYLEKNGGKMDPDSFAKGFLGSNDDIYKITPELNSKFSNQVIKLDDFISNIKSDKSLTKAEVAKYSNLARKMSKLQPEVEGVAMLSKQQVKDVYRGGALNMPEFIQNLYQVSTQDDIPFVKTKAGKSSDPYKFVSHRSLEELKNEAFHYANEVIEKAKKSGKDIDMNFIKKASRKNLLTNALNWGTGFAVSAMFLSTFIPKIQYFITRKLTGVNEFPGTAEYNKKKQVEA